MSEPNKNLESDAPLAALESWLRTLIREETQGFKAELTNHLDNPIRKDYMSLIDDWKEAQVYKGSTRLDAEATCRSSGDLTERHGNAGARGNRDKRTGLPVSIAGCRGGGH